MTRAFIHSGLTGVCLVLCALATHVHAQAATAEATPETNPETTHKSRAMRVTVLRASAADVASAAERVDAVLLRDLNAIAGIENPQFSPVDYEEVQLTVGCSDEDRTCLGALAAAAEADALVIRKLSRNAEGHVVLSLVYLDTTASEEPSRVELATAEPDFTAALEAAVPKLVRGLFGIPEPVDAAPAQAPAASVDLRVGSGAGKSDEQGRVGVWSWITMGAGVGVLTAGVVFALSAKADFNDFKKTDVTTTDDIVVANAKFDDAENKALLANILLPAGVVLTGLGATLLMLDLSSDDVSSGTAARLTLQPRKHGGMVVLAGSWGGRP